MNHQINNILKLIQSRSLDSMGRGGDGFVSSKNLEFDVGLNAKTVRRELDKLVAAGHVISDWVSVTPPTKAWVRATGSQSASVAVS